MARNLPLDPGFWYGKRMKLPGRLDSTTLGDVLGALHRERATGVLELVEWVGVTAGRTHRVHLLGGLVSRIESTVRVARLGEILRREGFFGEEGVRRLARSVERAQQKLAGEILVEEGLASSEAVSAALRWQLKSRLDALFALDQARIRFHVARLERGPDTRIPLSPREFLHGRPRARDRAVRSSSAAQRPRDFGASRCPPTALPDPRRARALACLGLDLSADRAAVQRAFRRLASQTHPDRFPSATAPERARLMRQFAELSAAYHELVA